MSQKLYGSLSFTLHSKAYQALKDSQTYLESHFRYIEVSPAQTMIFQCSILSPFVGQRMKFLRRDRLSTQLYTAAQINGSQTPNTWDQHFLQLQVGTQLFRVPGGAHELARRLAHISICLILPRQTIVLQALRRIVLKVFGHWLR